MKEKLDLLSIKNRERNPNPKVKYVFTSLKAVVNIKSRSILSKRLDK